MQNEALTHVQENQTLRTQNKELTIEVADLNAQLFASHEENVRITKENRDLIKENNQLKLTNAGLQNLLKESREAVAKNTVLIQQLNVAIVDLEQDLVTEKENYQLLRKASFGINQAANPSLQQTPITDLPTTQSAQETQVTAKPDNLPTDIELPNLDAATESEMTPAALLEAIGIYKLPSKSAAIDHTSNPEITTEHSINRKK